MAFDDGNRRCANVALHSAASCHLPLTQDAWKQAVASRVPPKTLDANLAAFGLGAATQA